MTKNVVGKVLLPIIKSTQIVPRARETAPSKSLSIKSVWTRFLPKPKLSVHSVRHNIHRSSSINKPKMYPFMNNGLRCLRSLSPWFSNVACIGSKDNWAMVCPTSSSDKALNFMGRTKKHINRCSFYSIGFFLWAPNRRLWTPLFASTIFFLTFTIMHPL